MDENNLKLINLIKSSPCIYDKTNVYYSNKDYIKVKWFKISNQMQLPVPVCQKRWRYLRDYFVRQLRIYQHENTKSTWPFFETMSFVIPFSTTRKRSISNNKPSKINTISKFNVNNSIENESPLSTRENTYTNKEEMNIFECLSFYQKDCSNQISNEKFSDFNSMPEANDQAFNDDASLGILKPFGESDLDKYRNITIKTEEIDSDSVSIQEQYYSSNIKKRKITEKLNNNYHISNGNNLNELKTNINSKNDAEHTYFFKSLLSNIRNIDQKFIVQFRTEILQLISKYQILTDHEKNSKKLFENYNKQNNNEQLNSLVENSDRESNFSDVVIIETDNFNWRDKLNEL